MAEGGHWYDKDGKLVVEVPVKTRPGEFRPPTLADARKMGLAPSVTTVQKLLANPVLIDWIKREVARAAIKYPKGRFDSEEAHIKQLLEGADEYRDWASMFGTSVHFGISQNFRGMVGDERDQACDDDVQDVVDGFLQWYSQQELVCERSEHTFISPDGYAGTVDWLGQFQGRPSIMDFKTRDFNEDDVLHNRVVTYEENGIQLSGYACGTNNRHRARLSCIISRTVPGLVVLHEWKDADIVRHDRAWSQLWELWQVLKGYYPGEDKGTQWQRDTQAHLKSMMEMRERDARTRTQQNLQAWESAQTWLSQNPPPPPSGPRPPAASSD